MGDFMTFGFSFLLNSIIALLIIRYIYYPVRRDKDYVLTFLAFNTLTFLISSLLSGVDLSVGFGFSLFAIFSILRYRTDPIPIREMTYLFVMMALAGGQCRFGHAGQLRQPGGRQWRRFPGAFPGRAGVGIPVCQP